MRYNNLIVALLRPPQVDPLVTLRTEALAQMTPQEFTADGDRGLMTGVSANQHMTIAFVQALLRIPVDRAGWCGSCALTFTQIAGNTGNMSQAVSMMTRRRCAFPAFVMLPRRTFPPLLCSEGTMPAHVLARYAVVTNTSNLTRRRQAVEMQSDVSHASESTRN